MSRFACLAALALLVAGAAAPGADNDPPSDPRTNEQLLTAMGGPLPVQRLAAAKALGARGPKVLPLLRQALADDDWRVRRSATDALAEMQDAAAPAAPDLVKALEDKNEWVRDGAAAAIAKIGPKAGTAAAKALARAAADPCFWVRASALSGLTNVTKDKAILLPAAVAAIRIHESGFAAKRHAVAILKKYGADYRQAAGALVDMLQHPPQGMWDCTAAAVDLLIGMGEGAKAVAPLAAMMPSTFRGRALNAARLLAKLGALAVPAIPALEKAAASHTDDRVRKAAAEAIETIRQAASAAKASPARKGGKTND